MSCIEAATFISKDLKEVSRSVRSLVLATAKNPFQPSACIEKIKTIPVTYSLPQLPFFPLLYGGEVVDRRVLYHRQEDEDKTDPEVNVHRLDVRDPRHGGVNSGDDGGHGQHRGDACPKITMPCVSLGV